MYIFLLGNKVRMNFLAFFSSRLIKVLGATIEEKKTKLPIKKGIKKRLQRYLEFQSLI